MSASDQKSDVRFVAIEGRLATLETQIGFLAPRADRTENKIDLISERLTRLEERVSHLPTQSSMVKIVVGALTVFAAIVAFQVKIQQLLGLAGTH